MTRHRTIALLAVVGVLAATAHPASATSETTAAPEAPARNAIWASDTVVTDAFGDEGLFQLRVVSDAASGAYVVWQDRRWSFISVQRMDANGTLMWQSPVRVATISGERFKPAAVADGSGGVIVAWTEGRSGGCYRDARVNCDIYAQRFDGNGARLWGADGVAVVIAERNQGVDGIALAGDGNGGVYAAWEDARPPDCCKVFAQRLNASGQPQWTDGGIQVSIEPFIAFGPMFAPPQIVADGQGGAILVWIENQVDPLDGLPPLHAQRIDSNGDALWSLYGLPVGLQLLGRALDEETPIRVADAYQRVSDHHLQRPADSL